MSRALTAAARRAIGAQESDEAFLILLTIDHPSLAEPIRVVRNNEDVTSRGNLYVGLYFDISLPDEDPDQIPSVTIEIDNVSREITAALRGILEPLPVTLEVIMASAPDVVEAGPYDMTLNRTQTDALVISGTVSFEDVLNRAFPADSYTPADYPGLF